MSKSVSVKYMFAGSLRRTKLDQISFHEFNKRVSESFPRIFEKNAILFKNLAFRYVDEEEEIVTITCDHELAEAFQHATEHNRILLVYIDDISKTNNRYEAKSKVPKSWRKMQAPQHSNSFKGQKISNVSSSHPKLRATFLDDIAFQDNSFVSRGENIVKSWRLATPSGIPEGCSVQFVSGYDLGKVESLPLAKVMPNSTFDIKIKFSAPQEDGEFRSYWRLVSPDGQRFGPKLWTVFHVCGEGSLHETTESTKKDPNLYASFVEDVTLPDASKVGFNQRLTKIWRLKSDHIIPDGCELRFLGGNLQPITKCVPLTHDTNFHGKLEQISGVPPKYAERYFSPTLVRVVCDGCNKKNLENATSYWHCDLNDLDLCNLCKTKTDREKKNKFFTVSAEILTPTVSGRYRNFWRMVSPSGTHFGPTLWCDVYAGEENTKNSSDIRPSHNSCLFAQNLNCTFLEDVTIPDGCQVEAGASLQKIWRLSTQSGLPEGCRLVFTSGDNLGVHEQTILPAVQGPSDFDVYLTIKVPSEEGTYRGYWRLVSPQGKRFGPSLWTDIKVANDILKCSQNDPPKVNFVADVTIPDASKISMHKIVKKTWRLKSNRPFPKGVHLKQVGGNKIQVIESAVFEEVEDSIVPGDLRKTSGLAADYYSANLENIVTVVCDGCCKRDLQNLEEGYWHSDANSTDFCNACKDNGKYQTMVEIDVSVKILTPEKEGRTRSFWKLSLEDGQSFGPKLWIDMDVKSTTRDERKEKSDISSKETCLSDIIDDQKLHCSVRDIQIIKQIRSMGFVHSDNTILKLIKRKNGNISQIVVALSDQQ